METSLEQALIEVWRQALVENAKSVHLGSQSWHPEGVTPLITQYRIATKLCSRFPSPTSSAERGQDFDRKG